MMTSEVRLFVGNLPQNTDANELKTAFSAFGQVTNVDLKSKAEEEARKSFAFVTLSTVNHEVESCIKHFSLQNFKGHKLYVTRARESFLERLQKERALLQEKQSEKSPPPLAHDLPNTKPILNSDNSLKPRKRKNGKNQDIKKGERVQSPDNDIKKDYRSVKTQRYPHIEPPPGDSQTVAEKNKNDSDRKRIESLKRKRQEFKEKKMIIKSGLGGVDKVQNKKVLFSDVEDIPSKPNSSPKVKSILHNKQETPTKKKKLFEKDDSGDELNFDVKKQFEGKKGQKVLDLQSRYKSDKRFVLDERFVNDDQSEEENVEVHGIEKEENHFGEEDEKSRQLTILQDVLGIPVKTNTNKEDAFNKKTKSTKLGMFRFDPLQPEHAKFLAPAEIQEQPKKSKQKKSREKQEEEVSLNTKPEVDPPKIEVSQEKFYKVSETLKETITQPTSFSLRSLFGNVDEETKKDKATEADYNSLELTNNKKKIKNSLDPSQKNPFVYDSSDSEDEHRDQPTNMDKSEEKKAGIDEPKAVWKENLFFSNSDLRLKEGLAFFIKPSENEVQKERRELKSLMKKRIYNKERKNQMFQRKIGGRRKTMKKSYKKKS